MWDRDRISLFVSGQVERFVGQLTGELLPIELQIAYPDMFNLAPGINWSFDESSLVSGVLFEM
ncbi:MAG: hypothetical protein R3B91_03110 [Planctomycetaceae bacterium]